MVTPFPVAYGVPFPVVYGCAVFGQPTAQVINLTVARTSGILRRSYAHMYYTLVDASVFLSPRRGWGGASAFDGALV